MPHGKMSYQDHECPPRDLLMACKQIVAIMPRRYQLQELGLEIFFTGHGSLFLTFRSKRACNDCLRTLQGLPAVQLQKFRSSKKWTKDWVNGKVGASLEFAVVLSTRPP